MPKSLSFVRGLSSILFWSVISAAFIGPGTITTAGKAGASFGMGLLWALGFSVAGTFIMQEAAARITLASGKNLGEVLGIRYGARPWVRWVLFGVVLIGCMAFEAGNLLGAVAGLGLIGFTDSRLPATVLAVLAASLLALGRIQYVARILGLVVALMGVAFLYLAWRTGWPAGAGDGPGPVGDRNWLVLGLIGTTLVPYNLFLASGISPGQSLREMRIGMAGAIGIGGLISAAIMLTATGLTGNFSFSGLGEVLGSVFGPAGRWLFAFGLLAAGFTSAVTAPLAAAITAASLLGTKWSEGRLRFRLVWALVLLFGLCFVWAEVQPIPVIIAAQGLNGLLLPLLGLFLFLAINDRQILGDRRNNRWQNLILLAVIGVVCLLGIKQISQALQQAGLFPAG